MPTTLGDLFRQFNLGNFKQSPWGIRLPLKEKEQGVYVVSTSSDPNNNLGLKEIAEFDDNIINIWVNKLPDFKIDREPANLKNVKSRLSRFWLPDESILYIGKAPFRKDGSGINNRINEFYLTAIGENSPHSGGQWIKTLKGIEKLTVYHCSCNNPDVMEDNMLDFFIANVSSHTKYLLHDKINTIPFANIKFKSNKKHGFKHQTVKKNCKKQQYRLVIDTYT